MKAMVVYSTRHGQTAKIATRIADMLRVRGSVVDLVDAEGPSEGVAPAGADMVLVAAPIHLGGYPRAVVRFVRRHRVTLQRVPSAFLSVGLAVASKTHDGHAQTMPHVEQFLERTGWHPRRVELVAGALPYSKYNPFVRLVMRGIAKAEGGDTDTSRDHEYTDWAALERFVEDFVASAGTDLHAVA